jgi:hypothetical protein
MYAGTDQREGSTLTLPRCQFRRTPSDRDVGTCPPAKVRQPVDHVVSNFDVQSLLEHVSIWINEIVIIDARVSTAARESKARDAKCSMHPTLPN